MHREILQTLNRSDLAASPNEDSGNESGGGCIGIIVGLARQPGVLRPRLAILANAVIEKPEAKAFAERAVVRFEQESPPFKAPRYAAIRPAATIPW